VGGGTMGIGIAYVFAQASFPVWLVESSAERAAILRHELCAIAQGAMARGRLVASEARALVDRIEVVGSIRALPLELTAVIESVPEDATLKRQVLVDVEQRQPRFIGTNTSSIPVRHLATALTNPSLLVGTHFFNPVWALKLVELVRGDGTDPRVLASAEALVARLGKTSIVVADVAGFATSRLDFAAALEAMRMLEDGVASADDIDTAATVAYRHPVGPLRLSDIVGLDVRLDIARLLEAEYGERFRPPQILIDLVARGLLGRKSGQGFHRWPETTTSTRMEHA
jgi:3-hydroxybutyryl-CoA dehydrogenase